jgi:hypothetical protein
MSTPISQNPFRLAFLLTIGFALFFTALLLPAIYSIDGNAMLAVSESLVTHRGFTVPESLGIPGVCGRVYSHWYPLLSILAVPFVYAVLVASRVAGLPFRYLAAVFALLLTGALTAATSGMIALLTLRLGGSRRGAWLAAVSFGIRLGAFFAGLALLAKPTGGLVGRILACCLLVKRVPLPRSILPRAGTGVGFAIYVGYNILRFGQPPNFGISSPFRIAFFLPGVAALLASPGYGPISYCPPVILGIFGFRKAMKDYTFEALTIASVFAAFLFLHSFLWYWYAYREPGISGLCALTEQG